MSEISASSRKRKATASNKSSVKPYHSTKKGKSAYEEEHKENETSFLNTNPLSPPVAEKIIRKALAEHSMDTTDPLAYFRLGELLYANDSRLNTTSNRQAVVSPIKALFFPSHVVEKPTLESIWDCARADVEMIVCKLKEYMMMYEHTRSEDGEDSLNMLRKEVKALSQIFSHFKMTFSYSHITEVEAALQHIICRVQQIGDDILHTKSFKRADALYQFIGCLAEYIHKGELPDEMPPVPVEMTVYLFSNTNITPTTTPRSNSSSQLIPQTPATPYATPNHNTKERLQQGNSTTTSIKRGFLKKIVGKTPKKTEG